MMYKYQFLKKWPLWLVLWSSVTHFNALDHHQGQWKAFLKSDVLKTKTNQGKLRQISVGNRLLSLHKCYRMIAYRLDSLPIRPIRISIQMTQRPLLGSETDDDASHANHSAINNIVHHQSCSYKTAGERQFNIDKIPINQGSDNKRDWMAGNWSIFTQVSAMAPCTQVKWVELMVVWLILWHWLICAVVLLYWHVLFWQSKIYVFFYYDIELYISISQFHKIWLKKQACWICIYLFILFYFWLDQY